MSFTGLTWFDRRPEGTIAACRNVTGTFGASGASRSNLQDSVTFGCHSNVSPTAPTLMNNGAVGPYVGLGGIVTFPRADGITDGVNVIQGVRVFDPQVGAWTTPDAYQGNVHNPASQKSYLWNGNNPVSYSDPSGFINLFRDSEYEGDLASDPNNVEPGPSHATNRSGDGKGGAKKPTQYDGMATGTQISVPGKTDTEDFKDLDAAAKGAAATYGGLVTSREIGCALYCTSPGHCHYGPATLGSSTGTSIDLTAYSGMKASKWHQHLPGDGVETLSDHAKNAGEDFATYSWLTKGVYSIYTSLDSGLKRQDFTPFDTLPDSPPVPIIDVP